MPPLRTNWGGNRTWDAVLHVPSTVEELQHLVAATPRLRPLGSRHSFNGLADPRGHHVSLHGLEPFVEVDAAAATARVSAWSTYADVAPELHRHDVALPNLASLPHISIAGAIATATHGSGNARTNLAGAVSGLEVVDGRGEFVVTTRADQPDTLPGWPVHLGGLGVVVAVTLDLVEPAPVHQRAYVDLPAADMVDHLDEVMAGADSVSCFTTWRDDVAHTVLHKSTGDPDDDPVEVFGARRATTPRHPILGLSTDAVTEQLGRPGPWYDRLPHFRADATPSAGAEVQSEWFVDRTDGPAAAAVLWAVGERLRDALQISEVRTVAADDLWLSPAYQRDVTAFHFTWTTDLDVVRQAIDVVEQALAPFDPVPHWGKVSHADRDVYARRYDRLADVAALAERCDPDHRFRNDVLDDLFG